MPPPPDARDPRTWLRRARSSLAKAQAGRTRADILYSDLCFDAQQAAEKAAKAVLISRSTRFPKTHSIERLLSLVSSAGVVVPAEIRMAARLSAYAEQGRYPGAWEEASEADHRAAVELAERVVRWAEGLIESPGQGSGAP